MRKPSEINIGEYTLEEILERHVHWLNKDREGWENMRADLRNANLDNVDLCFANLCYVDLSNVDLSNTNLRYASLYRTILCNANLRYTDLSNATLSYADLSNVNLSYADLSNANLNAANLHNANLRYTDLSNADLSNAKNIPFIPLACPSDGAFIAWKKVDGYLIKLEIPENAKRSSATTQKCRASEAKVLGIYTLDEKETDLKNVLNTSQRSKLDYIVGETIYPDSFDENRWNECSHGIHFFIDKQDAINY